MNFSKILKKCQLERHMTNDTFSKYIGKSRTWLQWIYSKNPKVEKFLLSEMTMYDLHEKLGISEDVMLEYNQWVLDNRITNKDESEKK